MCPNIDQPGRKTRGATYTLGPDTVKRKTSTRWQNNRMCLACSLRERTERDVYVASAWHPDLQSIVKSEASKLSSEEPAKAFSIATCCAFLIAE